MASNEKTYRLQGLSCTDCAAQFEKNIRNIDAVDDVKLNFGAAKVTVKGNATLKQIEKAGAFDHIKVFETNQTFDQTPILKKRETILTILSLLFIVIGYSFHFTLGEQNIYTIGTFLLAIIVGGYHLFFVGVSNLSRLIFDMKTLMTIAIIGAAFIGQWGEAAVVVFLFALSEALEQYSIDKARASISTLIDIAPNKATIRRDGELINLDVDDIQINDVMVIKPGEKLAMDGEVIQGKTTINQAAITGESLPVQKTVGDDVFAGTLNEEGSIEVRITKRVEDTTIAKIIHLVEEAQAEKAPSQQFVDQFAKYYTPIIMLIAFLVAIVPPLVFMADWSKWVYLGLATLVVGCPCALVISTPVAIVTAIGNAARHGVLIKGGIHLEETGRLDVIAFDKTGTLTEGKPEVTDIIPLSTIGNEEILKIATAIEQFSQHPIASAIINHGDKHNINPYDAEAFQSITGKGAKALINNTTYYIGNTALYNEFHIITEKIAEQLAHLQRKGKTAMLIGTDKEIIGIIAVADNVRTGTSAMIQQLKELGIKKTLLLTGDNKATGHAIGEQLNIDTIQADLLPEQKLEVINEVQQSGQRIAMVGDGINDAPALASATVGIAMGGAGTDAALETADIALMSDDLEKLPYTISLSRKAIRIIKENISFSLGLKIIALLLVIPGWLTLWLAILTDVGATLLVVLNSMRLMRTKL